MISGDLSPSCVENYKYCSDYRGNNTQICENTKPYDISGNYIDLTSECKLNDNGICQRVSKWCREADGNPIRCSIISQKIKNNNINHCVYDNENNICQQYRKKCEDITRLTNPRDFISNCTNNIPEDFLTSYCEYDNNNDKCVTKKNCQVFKEKYYANLCNAIQPNCLYENNECMKKNILVKKKYFLL